MSDKIKASDLFEEDLTKEAKKSFEEMNAVMKDSVGIMKAFVAAQKSIQTNKLSSSSDINKQKKDLIETIDLENKLAQKKAQAAKIIDDAAKKQIASEKALQKAIEDETKALVKQTKEQQKANSAYSQADAALSKLSKRQKDNSIAGREMSKTARLVAVEHENLRAKIDIADHSVGNFQRNVGNYSMQLRQMQKELAGMEPGTKQFDALSKKAGELKDKIGDAKDSIKAFSSTSKATQAKTLFGQIGSDLADLNFADAADKAKQFGGVIKSISLNDVIGGVKNFGTAIVDMGKAILLNPLALFVAAVAGLSYVIYGAVTAFSDFNKATKTLNESLKESEERISKLGEKQADYLIKLAVAQGKLTKAQGEAKGKELNNYLERTELVKKYSEDVKKLADELELSLADTQNGRFKENYTGDYKEQLRRMKFNRDAEKLQNRHRQEMGFLIKDQILDKQILTQEATNEERKELDKKNADEREKRKTEREKRLKEEEGNYKKNLDAYNEWADKMNKAIDDEEEAKKKAKEKARKKEIDDWKQGVKDAEEIADGMEDSNKKAAEEKKKRLKEELDTVISFAEEAAKRKDALLEKQLNNDLEMRQRNILQQQALAIAGKDNILAFEKAAAAKDEREKQKLAERAEKREKRIAFVKLLASYAGKGDPDEALTKSVITMAIAGAIAGSYIEGTENVGEDLKGNKMHNGKDGYVIAVDGRERILNPNQNAMIGDMSNDELAKLARDHQNGDLLPRYITDGNTGSFAQNTTNALLLLQVTNLTSEIKEIKQVLRDRPVSNTNLNNLGEVVDTKIINGLIKQTTQKRNSPLNYI